MSRLPISFNRYAPPGFVVESELGRIEAEAEGDSGPKAIDNADDALQRKAEEKGASGVIYFSSGHVEETARGYKARSVGIAVKLKRV